MRKALGIVSLVVIGDKGHTRSGSTHMHMYCHFHPFFSLEKEAKSVLCGHPKGRKREMFVSVVNSNVLL